MNYNIYIRSNEHPRTMNSYQNSRCYFTQIKVEGKEALAKKVAELREAGEHIYEVRTNLGTLIDLNSLKQPTKEPSFEEKLASAQQRAAEQNMNTDAPAKEQSR